MTFLMRRPYFLRPKYRCLAITAQLGYRGWPHSADMYCISQLRRSLVWEKSGFLKEKVCAYLLRPYPPPPYGDLRLMGDLYLGGDLRRPYPPPPPP